MSISFICIFNNKVQLDRMLKHSYDTVLAEIGIGIKTNLLLIDNRDRKYKSASNAFNKEIQKIYGDLGDILVFIHQDIAFDNVNFWSHLVEEFYMNQNQIIGAAGVNINGKVLSNLKYFENKSYITEYQIDKKEEVLSLDECCFAIPKELFLKLYFDENTCDHWHLYGVDLCYCARELYGTIVTVLPDVIYHKERKGGLSVDRHYLDTLWKVTKKHRKFTDRIYTSCYNIKTNPILATLDILKYRIRIVARKVLKKK